MSRVALALLALFTVPALARPACPQFPPGGHLPALLKPKLAHCVTVLCNVGYAVAASGVTRDRFSLAHARALLAVLQKAVRVMEADASMPVVVPAAAKAKTVANPFGNCGRLPLLDPSGAP